MPTLAIAAFVLLSPAMTALPQPRLVAQLGHSAPVHAVAYSPDGRLVATASADATAKVWDAVTGHELRTLAGHTDDLDAVAFSPDGKLLATGSRDKTAKLWSVATGEEVRTLPHGNGAIVAVAFSPDGRTVLTGGWDSAVTFWDVKSGEPVRTLSGFDKGVSSIAVSADGKRVIAGSSDHTARLFDAASGTLLRTLAGHTNTVTAVAFSPDSRLVATASWDRTIKVWEADSGRILHTLINHASEVTSVAFSPDGRHLLSGGRDLTAVLWDAETGKARGQATGHTDWVASVAFSPDSRYLLTASHDKTAKRYDLRGELQPLTFTGRSSGVWAVAVSPDGRLFATGGRDGSATLWDTSSGQPIRFLDGHAQWVSALSFAPDGKTLATGSWDMTVKLWSVHTGALVRTLAGHRAAVTSAIFSPDGRLLATRATDDSAKIWDAATGAVVHTFERPVDSLAFSSDGRFLVTGWNAGALLWDTSTWQQQKVIGPHTFDFEMRAVAFSPDGRVVLTASGDGTAKLWNATSGAALRTWNAHADEIRSAVFSADGRLLLTAGSDRIAKLWNAATGAEIRTFAGHGGAVNMAILSRDGAFVLTASDDGTARLWETGSGRALATMIAFGEKQWAVVDRDGRFDGSNGGETDGLHWVTGDEVIALDQLQSRFYDPYLLAKHLGTTSEPLRDVTSLAGVGLGPEVTVAGPAPGSAKVTINVRNRGGGIGKVRVLVNHKEFVDDACGTRSGSSQAAVECVVDLTGAHILRGEQNTIDVVAANADDSVTSRGATSLYQAPADGPKRRAELYAIVAGISEYASRDLRLKYAAKDANDMARAIELAASGLLGADRVHITRLVTGDPAVKQPTKPNLLHAFAAIAGRAQPEDVLVVYLAGHGTAIGDDYVFPTRDAATLALTEAGARGRDALTGTELAELVRKIKALKQVMIVDTCAAGAVAGQFARSERSSIVRALKRLSSRTGFHVLMGSAADAYSYESDAVGQGLLTYALLQGMKGSALREDGLLDVSKWFQHAADQVPLLTRRNDRVQRPGIAAPGGLTFDIGRLGPAEREQIPVTPRAPVVLRPRLLNSGTGIDDLDLTVAFENALREDSYAAGKIEFGGDDYPGGLRPEGMYRVEEVQVIVQLVLSRERKPMLSVEVTGETSDLPSLIARLTAAVVNASTAPADRP